MNDLKEFYQAPNKDNAEYNLLKLEEKRGEKYPMVLQSWQSGWEYLSHFFNILEKFEGLVTRLTPLRASIARSGNTLKQKALLSVNLRFLSSFIVRLRKLLRNEQRLYKVGL